MQLGSWTAVIGLLLTLIHGRAAHAAPSLVELSFEPRPAYLPSNVLSLTFDDGPDEHHTAQVLDVLREKNVKATFFVNAANKATPTDPKARALIERIVAEGHILANHTGQHLHLPTLSDSEIEAEIMAVQAMTRDILGEEAGTLTLLRAPFGEPFQDNFYSPIPEYQRIAPIFARHGLHIGWNVDTFDWACSEGDADCVLQNFVTRVQTPGLGDYGIVLLHSINSQTPAALPAIIDYALDQGFQFWSVEDVVKARFGKTSAETMANQTNTQLPPDCASPAWVQGHSYKVGDKVVFENQVFTAQNADNPGYHPKISTWYWAAGPLCL